MQNHSLPRVVGWIAMVVALLLPAAVRAQSGRIAGTVTDKAGQPVPGASVVVLGTGYGTLSKADGAFLIDPVPAGTYRVSVSHLGFRTETAEDVTVAAGQAAQLAVSLEESPVEIAGVVVSASRRPERITDAPATITSIDTRTLDNSVGNTWAGALKEVKGLDFIQVGMTSIAINARGFNSSFNNRMLMVEDGRIAVLPENGLPVGQFTAVPKVDLAGVEVLVGPGAALYGADASNGVVTLLTKDPKQFPGTTAEVTGGNRSYKDVQVRQAGVFANGDWGYKVSGEYQEAKDFSNILTYNITGVAGAPGGIKAVKETDLGINSIDWDAKAARATASLVRYFGSNGKIDLSGGLSQSDGVGQTNVGRNQLRDWGYNFVQLRASNPNWFFNAYRTQSTSGESFAINRYADAWARNPSLSPDSLRMLSDWPSDGQLYAAELQNNFGIRQLLNTRITWGAQYRHDKVSSKRQWLTDRLTGEDLSIDQKGIYAQTETPFSKYASLVLAGRYDDHENYDAQFSPKAALLLHPAPNQTLRVSYNRAFKSPTTLQTNFYIPDWTAVIAIYGNTEGFTIKNSAGATVATYKPLEPEENRTWEAGYKGILGDKVFLDLAGYYSKYNNFLSPLAIIANPFTGATATFAYDAKGQKITNLAGIAPIALTYFNLGKATLKGFDGGVNYYATRHVGLSGTLSLVKMEELDTLEVPRNYMEAAALNSPVTKWTLGATLRDLPVANGAGNLLGGLTFRYVNGYYFRSGINTGNIPSFGTLDLNLGYRIPRLNSTVSVGVSNLYTCSQDPDHPFLYATTDAQKTKPTNRSKKCGVDVGHQEMINMPNIGTMVFVGVRYSR